MVDFVSSSVDLPAGIPSRPRSPHPPHPFDRWVYGECSPAEVFRDESCSVIVQEASMTSSLHRLKQEKDVDQVTHRHFVSGITENVGHLCSMQSVVDVYMGKNTLDYPCPALSNLACFSTCTVSIADGRVWK